MCEHVPGSLQGTEESKTDLTPACSCQPLGACWQEAEQPVGQVPWTGISRSLRTWDLSLEVREGFLEEVI